MQEYDYPFLDIVNSATPIGALFYAAVLLALAWGIGKLVRLAVKRALKRVDVTGRDATSVRFLGQLAQVIVYILAFLCYVSIIPALHSLGAAWLASVGVISVIIGLATQSTLSNVIAGISLILYRPFRLGDRIQVVTPTGTEIGKVESVDLGYTRLRTPDGRRVVLANSLIASQTNINFSRSHPNVLWEVAVTVPQGEDIDRVRTIFLDAAKSVPKISKINGCFITNLTGEGAVITLSSMCLDPGDIAQIKSDVLALVKKQLDAEKISIA